MEILMGIVVFFIFIAAALKAGVIFLKILFTVLGSLIGLVVLIMLIPLGIGLATVFLIPAIILGVIIAIIKCIGFIF